MIKRSLNDFRNGVTAAVAATFVAAFLVAVPANAGGSPAEIGAGVYKSKCAGCHGPDGSGNTTMGKKMGLKDLGSAEVQKLTDEQLTEIITNGKGKMPAYGSKLTADQISGLVAYIRTLKK